MKQKQLQCAKCPMNETETVVIPELCETCINGNIFRYCIPCAWCKVIVSGSSVSYYQKGPIPKTNYDKKEKNEEIER
jgi:hypothetical protein